MSIEYRLYVIDTQLKGATDVVDVLMDTLLFRKSAYYLRDRYAVFYRNLRDNTMNVTSVTDYGYMLTNPLYDTRILQ